MITIAEVPEYIRQAEKHLTDAERQDVLSYLAAHPRAGDLIEGTGGIPFASCAGAGADEARAEGCG